MNFLVTFPGEEADAAYHLKECGYFEEALHYISQRENPKFFAEVTLLLVRQLTQQKQEYKQAALCHLETAFKIFLEKKCFVELGECCICKYLLTNNLQCITNAVSYFMQGHCLLGKIIAVIEMMEGFIISAWKPSLDHCWYLINLVEDVGRLLQILVKPTTQEDKHNMSLITNLLGLREGSDPNSLKYNHHLQPRIMKLMTRGPKKLVATSGEITKVEMRTLVRSFFGDLVRKYVPLIQRYLQHHMDINEECPDYRTHQQCTKEECGHLHEMAQSFHYENVFKAVVFLVRLEMNFHKICDVKEKTYEAFIILYGFFFPRQGHPVGFNEKVIQKVVRFLKNDVQEHLNKSVTNSLDSFFKKNKVAGIDLLIQSYNLYQLSGLDGKNLTQFLTKAEMKIKVGNPNEKHYHKLGFEVKFDLRSVTHILRHYHESQTQLHKCIPVKSTFECFNFLNFLARNFNDRLCLSFRHMLMIAELQLMTIFSTYLRLETLITPGAGVVIPASYLAEVLLWNNIGKKPKKTLSQCVTGYQGDAKASWVSNLPRQTKFLVDLMCGTYRSSFNIIADAFHSKECISTGEAERVLVLALVLLVNCFSLVPKQQCEVILREALHHIKDTDSVFPQHITDALEDVKGAQRRWNVVEVLEKLLKRKSEKLFFCTWRHKGILSGIWCKDLSYSAIRYETYTYPEVDAGLQRQQNQANCDPKPHDDGRRSSVADTKFDERDNQKQSIVKNEDDEYQDTQVDFYEAKQQQIRQSAASRIQRAYRKYHAQCVEIRNNDAKTTPPQHDRTTLFIDINDIDIDNTMCKVCQVHFSHDQKTGLDNEILADTNENIALESHTRSEHELLNLHHEQTAKLTQFKTHYVTYINPILEDTHMFLMKYKRENLPLSECSALEAAREELIKHTKNMVSEAKWDTTRTLREKEQNVENSYEELRSLRIVQVAIFLNLNLENKLELGQIGFVLSTFYQASHSIPPRKYCRSALTIFGEVLCSLGQTKAKKN